MNQIKATSFCAHKTNGEPFYSITIEGDNHIATSCSKWGNTISIFDLQLSDIYALANGIKETADTIRKEIENQKVMS